MVAVKIINIKAVEAEEDLAAIKSEVQVMQSLQHPHIVGFHSVISTPNKMYIVMDLVTGGELFDCIIARKAFSESEVRSLMQALLGAVDHMHKRHVVHQVRVYVAVLDLALTKSK
jgi:serine/threonine protein kinase